MGIKFNKNFYFLNIEYLILALKLKFENKEYIMDGFYYLNELLYKYLLNYVKYFKFTFILCQR